MQERGERVDVMCKGVILMMGRENFRGKVGEWDDAGMMPGGVRGESCSSCAGTASK